MAADLLDVLTNPDLQRRLFDPTYNFRQTYASLAKAIADKCPKANWDIVDQAWLLLRPSFLWFRTTQLGEKGTTPAEPLIIPTLAEGRTMYPLEPMGRYMDCLTTSGRADDQWWSDRFEMPRVDPQTAPLLICGNGHIQQCDKGHARRCATRAFNCSVCSGQRVVAGLNSLGDVMPRFIAEWDQDANGDLTPFTVSVGVSRKVGWICDRGHHYEAYIANRTIHGTGCRYCAANAVLPGLNDLPTTHPKLAALWDNQANGDLKPTDVSAGSHTKIHLRCELGHPFIREPYNLVRTNGRCPTCQGRELISGKNDLATLRPDVAAWWHPSKNGDLTPDMVKVHSGLKVWWQCEQGHEFQATVSNRTCRTKRTCPVDNGRWFLPGVNDLATQDAELIKDWDSALNRIEPWQTLPTNHQWWWTCRFGHTQHAWVANRRRSGGCTDCPPEDRVAQGQRKFARGRQGWDKRLRK
jgi:hypothetical protein